MATGGDSDRFVNEDAVVNAVEEYVSSELDDELVLLHTTEGHYYGVNEVGRYIWNLIDEPQRVETITDAVASDFDTTREECRTDVLEFLTEMSEAGLVEIEDE